MRHYYVYLIAPCFHQLGVITSAENIHYNQLRALRAKLIDAAQGILKA